MNAYELADDAKNIHTTIEALEFVQKAVPMLRQQADRIAELEKQTKPLSDEEIMDIAEQSDYSPIEIEMGYDYEIRIARAIEERHGIK